jgi:hypothetical protein
MVELDERFNGTAVGKCIVDRLMGTRVARFGGGPATATLIFTLE